MKKTINVNIGTVVFTMDIDAYNMLGRYLDDIKSRLTPDEEAETINDLEMRIADIFTESIHSPEQVVNTELVKRTIERLGSAEEFGERRSGYNGQRYGSRTRQLMRSRTNRILGGVCGGIAAYFNIDPLPIRILTFLICCLWWVYPILWIALPLEPDTNY